MPIVKRTPYHVQAYELIKNMILSGEIHCGEKINEIKLSQELQISRSPIREAIRILEQDGLVISDSYAHIVNPLDDKTIRDVYELRIGLESYAARLAVKNFTESDYEILIKYVDDCKKAEINGDFIDVVDLNTFFHNYIVSLTHNDYLIAEVERISNIVTLSRIKELREKKGDINYAHDDHTAIAKELLNGNEDRVEELMRQHLERNLIKLL